MGDEKISVIVPVFNSAAYLRQCLDSIVAAIQEYGNTELILIDNGSTDGSYEMLHSLYGQLAKIHQVQGATVAALRNFGAQLASGDYLSFIDSDCVVPRRYFVRAIEILASTKAASTGCKVTMPDHPTWIEETWMRLHEPIRDSYVHYLNSANFIVNRVAFDSVGGFDERLVTGEDAEIGLRLLSGGFKIYQSRSLAVVHLRNPKTLITFFRKEVWHGLGMFGTFKRSALDKPVLMTFLHLFLNLVGLATLLLSRVGVYERLGIFLVLSAFAPAATVFFRSFKRGGIYRPIRSWFLYWIYYMARIQALGTILVDWVRRPRG